jgi:hypothetical protein
MLIRRTCSRRCRAAVALTLLLAVPIASAVAEEPASRNSAVSGGFSDHVDSMAREVAAEHGLAGAPGTALDLTALRLTAPEYVPGTPAPFSLQETERELEPWGRPEKNFWRAISESMLVQMVPWVNNSFIRKNADGGRGEDWSRNIGWASWSNAYARSFEWDDNQFVNNQFSHPYHGNLYFNAGRSNGFSYYESMAFAFLNSWIWEHHFETFRPAINDWIKTSMGGSAIGEMTHRMSEKIVDNSAYGSRRTWGEIGGFLVNPVGGFNRAVTGQMGKHRQNSPTRTIPVRSHFELGAFGAREAVSNNADEVAPTPFTDGVFTAGAEGGEFIPFVPAERVRLASARFDLRYGDPFVRHDRPFDAFEFDIQLSFGSDVAALGRITIGGYLHINEYDWSEKNKHGFVVMQRYEYFNNEILQFGAQMFGFGLNSLFRAEKDLKVRTSIEGQVIVLGAIDSPYAENVGRTYDYGPGAGLRAEARLEEDGFEYVRLRLGSLYVDTINGGGEGRHLVSYGSLRAMVPIVARAGLGGEIGYIRRDAYFKDLPDFTRDNDWVRLFVTWVTK